jgi:DNA repair exonuclease SbcCD ATPase subunit
MSKAKKLTLRAQILKKFKEAAEQVIEAGKELNKLTPEDKEWVATKFERLSLHQEFEEAFGNKGTSTAEEEWKKQFNDDLPF